MKKQLQRGFSIITAIFLLVVLSFLGAAMLTFSSVQHQTSALDVMGTRAYQAARAGVEWAAFNVAASPANAAAPVACANVFAGSLGGTLAPFTVTVVCGTASYAEGGNTVWVYTVTSTATAGGGVADPNSVSRTITVLLAK